MDTPHIQQTDMYAKILEFLKGLLPLMLINLFVVVETLADKGSSSDGILAYFYIIALFPFAIAPLSVIYLLILRKKNPTKAKGWITGLLITSLLWATILIMFRGDI